MFTLLEGFPTKKLQSTLVNDFDIEKVFKYQNTYVLFLTENTPHEETLTILLLSETYKILEKIELYAAYTPGILNVVGVESNAIVFTFWSEKSMRLCYSESKKYPWQFKRLYGVSYISGLLKLRYLVVRS